MCLPEESARDVVLAELAGVDPGVLDAACLMGQITDLAVFISRAQGQLARLAGTLDASGGAAQAGHKSASAFLRTKCGVSPGRAAAVVAAARGLRELGATEKALHAGVISFDQAQVIVGATTGLGEAVGYAEQVLLDHAPGLDTARFRQFADEVACRANPVAAEEREKRRWEKRHLSFGLTLDNSGVLSGACGDAVSYEIVRTAAEAFGTPGGQGDTRTAAQRRMDGLVAACKAALDGGSAPGRHGSAPHITILVKDETLAQAAGAPPAQTGHGTALTARQVLSLCCGAQIGAIRWRDGLPLGVGRTMRTEPPGLRRALEARDRGCRWPGCGGLAAWATAHHIKGWQHGAHTSLGELVLLCHAHHHHFIHLLGWSITGSPNHMLHFTHPGGWLTLDSPLPGADAGPPQSGVLSAA